jgi:isochorismate synthase
VIQVTRKNSATLQQFVAAATAEGLPWVNFRLPGEGKSHCWLQLDAMPATFDTAVAGFVLAPFDWPQLNATYIRRDLSFTGLEFHPDELHFGTLNAAQLLRLTALQSRLNHPQEAVFSATQLPQSTTHQQYQQTVEAALTAIRQGELQKVVLSRTLLLHFSSPIHASAVYDALCTLYPDAFVSLCRLPDGECWVGASPELLVDYRADGLSTMSLAGTRPVGDDGQGWQPKEEAEQQIVTDYIREQLTALGMQVNIAPRETIRAAQVWHLRSRIEAQGQQPLAAVLRQLHPTPAVCGFPMAAARSFIATHESHPRRYYGGFLGPVWPDGSAQLYVNLRTAALSDRSASLYLGGGLVAGSDLAAEWAETEAKAQTLLAAFRHAGIDPQ